MVVKNGKKYGRNKFLVKSPTQADHNIHMYSLFCFFSFGSGKFEKIIDTCNVRKLACFIFSILIKEQKRRN